MDRLLALVESGTHSALEDSVRNWTPPPSLAPPAPRFSLRRHSDGDQFESSQECDRV